MAATTANIPIYAEGARGEQYIPVDADAEIYAGTMVVTVSGYLEDGVDGSGMFAGIAKERITGTGVDGAVVAKVAKSGCYWFLMSSGNLTDLCKPVYLVDNQTVGVSNPGTGIVVGILEALSDATRRKRDKHDPTSAGVTWGLVRIDGKC